MMNGQLLKQLKESSNLSRQQQRMSLSRERTSQARRQTLASAANQRVADFLQATTMSAERNCDFSDYRSDEAKTNVHSRLEAAAVNKGDSLVPLLLYGHIKSKGVMEDKYKTIAVTSHKQQTHDVSRDRSSDRDWPPYTGIRFEDSLRPRVVSKELVEKSQTLFNVGPPASRNNQYHSYAFTQTQRPGANSFIKRGLNISQDRLENKQREKGFRLRLKRNLGGKFDRQIWEQVIGTLNKGDPYIENQSSEVFLRSRKPHLEKPASPRVESPQQKGPTLISKSERDYVIKRIREQLNTGGGNETKVPILSGKETFAIPEIEVQDCDQEVKRTMKDPFKVAMHTIYNDYESSPKQQRVTTAFTLERPTTGASSSMVRNHRGKVGPYRDTLTTSVFSKLGETAYGKRQRYRQSEEREEREPRLYMKSLEQSETLKIFKHGLSRALASNSSTKDCLGSYASRSRKRQIL